MCEPSVNPSLQMHTFQQLWEDDSKDIVVNSPCQMWWMKVGFQQSICCYACMETEGIHFEHFPWLSESSNSKTVYSAIRVIPPLAPTPEVRVRDTRVCKTKHKWWISSHIPFIFSL
jgi:hypothetical protein